MALAPLFAYAWQVRSGVDLAEARGLAFSILVFSQLSHAFNSRHERASLASLGLLSNPTLLMACGSAAVIQVAILTIAPLQPVFGVASLSPDQWGLVVVLGLLPIAGMEAEKWLARRFARGGQG
jgi:magnesium-transporting ATPase (P-type)